jgi:hypothetical protein
LTAQLLHPCLTTRCVSASAEWLGLYASPTLRTATRKQLQWPQRSPARLLLLLLLSLLLLVVQEHCLGLQLRRFTRPSCRLYQPPPVHPSLTVAAAVLGGTVLAASLSRVTSVAYLGLETMWVDFQGPACLAPPRTVQLLLRCLLLLRGTRRPLRWLHHHPTSTRHCPLSTASPFSSGTGGGSCRCSGQVAATRLPVSNNCISDAHYLQ